MKTVYTSLSFALGASAALIPRDQCCFSLTASGGESGVVGQLSDGQNRIGQTSGLANTDAQYCINNGAITDGNGRGCILTSPTTQFQCDTGASPTSGFSVNSNGDLTYNGNTQFIACATGDNGGYNIYTTTPSGQTACVDVTLSTGGQCASGAAASSSSAAQASASSASAAQASASQASVAQASASHASAGQASASQASVAQASASQASAGQASASQASVAQASASQASVAQASASQASASQASVAQASASQASVAQASASQASVAQASASQASASQASVAQASASQASVAQASASQASVAQSSVAQVSASQASVAQSSSAEASATVIATSAPVASAPVTSAPAAQSTAPSTASSNSGSTCASSLVGAYQTPHAIIPIDKSAPDTAYGTQYNAYISSANSTIFNFDIPASYAGQQCTVLFLFPEQSQLTTSSFTESGSGGLTFSLLSSAANLETSYANAPAVSEQLDAIASVTPGNSYVVSTGACAAGTTQSIEVSSTGSYSLEYFEDWNPSPIGLFITSC